MNYFENEERINDLVYKNSKFINIIINIILIY